MQIREQALALMHELGLTPDTAETTKQQLAIESALENQAPIVKHLIGNLERENGELGARVDALEGAAARLIGALVEYGQTPWWLRAAEGFNELHRLAVEKDGV